LILAVACPDARGTVACAGIPAPSRPSVLCGSLRSRRLRAPLV